MSKLVEDLLILSRLDSNKLEFERKPVQLNELFADIQRQAARIAEPLGITVSAEGNNAVVLADANRLKQLSWILVDNALQHTPKGGTIRMDAVAKGRYVEITVSDTGLGIPTRHLSRVFERFYKASREETLARRSAGLGLSIAKGLVEAMDGKIEIFSSLGQGTRVILVLKALINPSFQK
jgi:signal transduction histidine kinase